MNQPERSGREADNLMLPSSDPMARKYLLEMPKPTLEDPEGDIERILSALRDVSDTGDAVSGEIHVPLGLVRKAARTLRNAAFRATAVVARRERTWELIDLLEGHDETDCFGLAIDVGTTTVSLYLVNMTKGEITNKLALDNPQAVHGEDILSRIHFCQEPRGLDTLQKLIVDCINEGMTALADGRGLRTSDIYALSVAGNPAMMHLLLGLDPHYLCREPYVPCFNQPLHFTAGELMLAAHPDAPVYVFPSLGSYFGGDVVAGVLASGMHKESGTSLLVDVGTNAEIVLGNREWLVVCAGAAGPALESGGAKAGMRAMDGAIETVRIDRHTYEPDVEIVGECDAKGICGSGLIDLVAELYLSGIIDPKGRVSDGRRSSRIRQVGDTKGYAVALAEKGEGPNDIVVDELDIGNLLRAKGAMYTALTLITERLGIGFSELDNFFVAGSFGEHIDPERAITIGMIPDIPLERFKSLGNSAGLGACLILLSYGLREEVEAIRSKTTYIQLTTENEFMNRLNAAIFIPHTNRELFPSVPQPA